jgi:flagellar basal-body rod modification protein FlgD
MIQGLIPTATELTSTGSNSGDVANANELGKDDFLKLLVAQLQAQDPLDPQSAEDFSAQLAQFSSLEQLTNVNDNLTQIESFEQAVNNASLVNLIGKNVDSPGDRIDFNTGETKTLNFSLSEEAARVEVDVFDSTGNPVTTLTLSNLTAGNNQALWNGKNGEGKDVQQGAYTFTVKAETLNGDEIPAQTFISGKITDVVFGEDGAQAVINGQKTAVSEISRVSI